MALSGRFWQWPLDERAMICFSQVKSYAGACKARRTKIRLGYLLSVVSFGSGIGMACLIRLVGCRLNFAWIVH